MSDQPAKPKLDALTSLRFLSALLIVVGHAAASDSVFHLDPHGYFVRNVAYAQAVSFFFVLSGFILTYNYSGLKGLAHTKHFLWARIGRIWPSHLSTALLSMAVHPLEYVHFAWTSFSIILANLLLVQAWIPVREYYYSINPVSWSISDEFFFYLSFILLIRPWRWGWRSKLFLGVALVVLSITLGEVIQESHPGGRLTLCFEYLPTINPLCRIFEFILGMSIADIWLIRRQTLNNFGSTAMTIVELLVVLLVAASVLLTPCMVQALPVQNQSALARWLLYCGGAPLFAALIFVVAFQKGAIAKLLAHPWLVWLGEISYSIYLVHFTLLRYLLDPDVQKLYAHVNNWLLFSLYVAIVILVAHLNFALVESPFRKLFRQLSAGSVTCGLWPWSCLLVALQAVTVEIKSWSKWKRLVIFLECTFIVTFMIVMAQRVEAIKNRFQFKPVMLARNINFANKLLLEEVQLGYAKDSMKLRLVLHSLGRNIPDYSTRLVFYDGKACAIAKYDYPPEAKRHMYLPTSSWIDEKEFTASECKNLVAIGLTVWSVKPPYQLLPVAFPGELNGKVIIPVASQLIK
ncbi:MAG: hypothetical protein C5B53_02225 [Candidatus Melainabacteria bacterium]|nr:MAG: hypothetical protein C5B53_02225 [Candidatus Melainabacteria bacterium]